jgi:hypothetical protein
MKLTLSLEVQLDLMWKKEPFPTYLGIYWKGYKCNGGVFQPLKNVV